GWLLVPPSHVDTARAYAGNLFLTPPSPSQQAALVAMDCTEELEGHRATYARNRQLLLEALPDLGLERIAPPDGAFYIWADVAHPADDSLGLCRRILDDTGVALAPGVDFDPVDGHRVIRFSFAPATVHVEEALRRLRPWFAAQPRIRWGLSRARRPGSPAPPAASPSRHAPAPPRPARSAASG